MSETLEEIKARVRAEKRAVRRRRAKKAIITILVVCSCAGLFYLIFTVHDVEFTGNDTWSSEQLSSILVKEPWKYNTLALYYKLKHQDMSEIPYIEKMDVSIVNTHKLRVTIYEKKVIACLSYMSQYIYFDKNGMVLKTSTEADDGVPVISGFSVGSIVLYQPLAVENNDIFSQILNLTQLVSQYEIQADRIEFSDTREATLYIGKIKVLLGKKQLYNDAVAALADVLPKTDGLSGTLDLENYTAGQERIVFTKDGSSK